MMSRRLLIRPHFSLNLYILWLSNTVCRFKLGTEPFLTFCLRRLAADGSVGGPWKTGNCRAILTVSELSGRLLKYAWMLTAALRCPGHSIVCLKL